MTLFFNERGWSGSGSGSSGWLASSTNVNAPEHDENGQDWKVHPWVGPVELLIVHFFRWGQTNLLFFLDLKILIF